MKKTITLLLTVLLFSQISAQDSDSITFEGLNDRMTELEKNFLRSEKMKVSGYIQSQYQYGEKDADLKVGTKNENSEGSFNRIGIRRGRIKLAYEEGIVSGVFQLDVTEKGLGVKDAYLNLKAPFLLTSALRVGVFDRPFGYEIGYSSSQRESPERSTIFQTLFPDERDLGAMLVLQAKPSSPLNFFKLEAGLFAGNGIRQETDNRKDFIGHLSANKKIGESVKLALGVSYYNGGVYQGTEKVYDVIDNSFVLNDEASNKGKYAKREYVGFDAQFTLQSKIGTTQLRGEYLFGQQPGSLTSTKSPNSSSLPTTDTYIRKINGGYVILVQDIVKSPFSVVLKYDFYDPNTKVAKDGIGSLGVTAADVFQNTFGFGGLWRMNKNVRLQAYYEINQNERAESSTAYNVDRKDNVFTLRLQYKF